MSAGLVHDYLLAPRGAERTFAAIAACWPEAPIYTLLYDEEGTNGWFASRDVRTSYLQRLGVRQKQFRMLLPLYPHATGRLPTSGHSLIVSSSSAFAHGVRADEAVHVCYCHTPFRYAWTEQARALREVPLPARMPLRHLLGRVRRWDVLASTRVTGYIANSALTQERIRRFWSRDSTIIHPPVAVERFSAQAAEDFFLLATELVPHKMVDVALRAARLADVPLKVVGTGPDQARLMQLGGARAEFLGRVSDEALGKLYGRARAFIVPNTEEFGIAAVEAQAAGTPVVAARAGGALETVIDGTTGVFVPPGDVDALAEALREVDFGRFSQQEIRRNAERFSEERFQSRLRAEVLRIQKAAR